MEQGPGFSNREDVGTVNPLLILGGTTEGRTFMRVWFWGITFAPEGSVTMMAGGSLGRGTFSLVPMQSPQVGLAPGQATMPVVPPRV